MKTKTSKMYKSNRAAAHGPVGVHAKKHSSKHKQPTSPRIAQQQHRNGKSVFSEMVSVKNPIVFPLPRGEVVNRTETSSMQPNDFAVQQFMHETQVMKSIQQPIQQSKNSKKKQLPPISSLRVTSYPDDGFLSGAWLFDLNVAPQWFKNALPTHVQHYQKPSVRSMTTPLGVKPFKASLTPMSQLKVKSYHEDVIVYSGAWLFIPNHQCPAWLQQALRTPVKKVNVHGKQQQVMTPPIQHLHFLNLHPDDGFTSGAWLFDVSCRPTWLQTALNSTPTRIPTKTSLFTQKKTSNFIKSNALPKVGNHVKPQSSDIGFDSGAWLFDKFVSPPWLQKALTSTSSSASMQTPFFTQKKNSSVINSNALPMNGNYVKPQSPNIGFDSGAWLFDNSVAPTWLQACLTSVTSKKQRPKSSSIFPTSIHVKQGKSKVVPLQQLQVRNNDPNIGIKSGAWLFDLSVAPNWFQNLIPKPSVARRISGFSYPNRTQKSLEQMVYLKPSPMQRLHVVADENVGFYSGAWLFDSDSIPEWFRKECFSSSSKKRHRSSETSFLEKNKKIQKQKNIQSMDKKNKHGNATELVDETWPFISEWAHKNSMRHPKKATNVDSQVTNQLFAYPNPNYYTISSLSSNPSTHSHFTYPYPNLFLNRFQSAPLHSKNNVTSKQHSPQARVPKDQSKSKIVSPPTQRVFVRPQSPDLDFFTGAWLFDAERVPHWMSKELPHLHPRRTQPQSTIGSFFKALKRPFWFIAYY